MAIDSGARNTSTTKPGQNISNHSQFFSAFGNGSTNELPTAGSNDSSSPKTNNPRYNQNDPSLFSSDTQSAGNSSLPPISLTRNASTMAGWASDMRLDLPPSPPGSAVTSSKKWPFNPSNLFTTVQPEAPWFSDFGQITPPDDDDQSILDLELREHENSKLVDNQRSTPPRRSRKTDRSSTAQQNEGKQPCKRTRKYNSRNSKRPSFDPNDPGDVRRSKFLERNRVAASKCREKKKEWTQNLESRARDLQTENNSLQLCVESLNEEHFYLKNQITEHKDCHIPEIQEYLSDPAHQVAAQNNLPSRNVFGKAHQTLARNDMLQPRSDVDGGEDTPEASSVASDEQALEALLTSSIKHETEEGAVSERVAI